MKRQSLREKALRANGRSQMCGTCLFRNADKLGPICQTCARAFIEGYKKGYTKHKEETK